MPYHHQNRVQSLINQYRSNPQLFDDDQLDELQNLAEESGINFSPIREQFKLRNVIQQASSGFLEGLTTIPVGKEPRTTYESIAHSLGHLVGFAPGIMAAPFSLGAKGAAKLGAKRTAEVMGRGAQLAGKNISVPMIFGDWAKKKTQQGISKSKLDSLDFFKRGAKTKAIAEQTIHLGAAMSISNIWGGPDEMMHGFVGGAVAGGMFGGLGNFKAIGNLLKSKDVKHHRRAEQIIKSGIGATMMGLPTYMRGEPIETVLYETILGGYFGYGGRPAEEAEGGKFVKDLMYYPEKDVVFTPDKHPDFNQFSKGAKKYIMDTSTSQAKMYLKKHYPKISQDKFNEHFRTIAENDIGKKATQEDVDAIMRQEATQHYFGSWEYVENPFEKPNKPQETSYEQQEDYDQSVNKPPANERLDAQKERYKDHSVFVVEMDGKTYAVRGASGEYKDSRVGDSRIDRPSDKFQGVKFTEINGIYQPTGGRFWRKFKPLAIKEGGKKVEYEMGTQDWWRLDNNLDRQNHYIYGGVKDKGTLNVRPYHIDYAQYSPDALNRELANTPEQYRNITQSYRDSLELEAEWYGKSVDEVRSLHDRRWNSNVLAEAEEAGYYIKGSKDTSRIKHIMKPGFSKNVTDWNKRQQLFHDKGLPLPVDTFDKPLNYIILNDLLAEGDKYTVRDKEGNIKEKYNDSNTDGTILFTPQKFYRMMDKTGLPTKKVSMNKPVVMFKHNKGVLMGKAAGAVAEGPMLEFMEKNNLDMVMFKSAAKQTGELKIHDYWYSEGNKKYEGDFDRATDVLRLDPTSIRLNLGTFENPAKMYGTHFVRQFFGNLTEAQAPGVLDKAFEEYYVKSYEGTKEASNAIEKYFKTGKDSHLKDIDINDIPIRYIHRIYDAHYNTKAGELIRNQIYKLDKEGALEEVDRFTKEEYRDYLARNDRIINLTGASESATKLFKHTRKYSDKVYKKYIIQRLISPKYKYSAKSWLSPKMPHVNVEKGTFKAMAEFNPDVIVDGKPMKLKELWGKYEKNKKKYQAYLDYAIIRVPADSISGTRVLRFDGYVGKEGTSIITRGNDNTYLGGADKDSDTVFLYQGLDKTLLDGLKKNYKEWQRDDATWIEGKSEKYDEMLRGKDDPRFSRMGSKFSPAMRMMVARNAAKGNAGLGYTMTARNTMLSWVDMLNQSGGEIKSGKLHLKLKADGSELRRLAREMINTSADAANYPNVTDFTGWRDHLFDTTFEATIGGKKATFSGVANHPSFGQVHKLQNILDPKGLNYPKAKRTKKPAKPFTLDEWQVELSESWGKLPGNAGNTYSRIARKAQEYGLDKPLTMDSIENYHKILRQANERINAKDSKDAAFVRQHLTKLYKVPIGTDISRAIAKAKRTGDWTEVLDYVSNDTFMVASNNAMAKKGLQIYQAFRENGVDDPTGVMDGILKTIASRATTIKNRHENLDPNNSDPRDTTFENFDAEIESFKVELIKAAANNKIPYNLLSEYFDIWLIGPYNYKSPKTRSGSSRLSMQSQNVSEKAWSEIMNEFENIYQNINKKVAGEEIKESAIFSLPPDYKNPTGKAEQVKTITDMVIHNVLKSSPLSRQEAPDRMYSRKAIGKKDFKEVEEFEQHMSRFPDELNPDVLVEGWLTEYHNYPRSVKEMNISDIKAMNRYFRDIDHRFEGDGLPPWVWWADPRSVDEAMWHKEKTFYKTGYSITPPKGGNRVIYKGVGTLGTVRNWFRQTNRQMDVYTDAIPDINNEKYKFRLELSPNESDAIQKGIILKLDGAKLPIAEKYLKQKYTVDKKEYTYQELVDKYADIYANDLETTGNEWLWARTKKGEDVNFSLVDAMPKWNKTISFNEYLRWNANGSFDIKNFIRKSVEPGDRVSERVPRIPLENIYRFQYEYKLEKIIEQKGLTGKAAVDFRMEYRKSDKTSFKPISRFEKGNYFPHLNFGWNKGARKEIGRWIEAQGDKRYNDVLADKDFTREDAKLARKLRIAELKLKYQSGEADAGGMDKHAIDELLSRMNYKNLSQKDIEGTLDNIGFNTRPENILERETEMPGWDPSASVIDVYKEKIIRAHYRNLGSVMANYRIDNMVRENPFGDFKGKDYDKYNPITPEDVHAVADKAKIKWDNNASFMKLSKKVTGKEHIDDMSASERLSLIRAIEKLNPPKKAFERNVLFNNWTDVWADYVRLYVRDAFGHQSTFPTRMLESMKYGDPLKLKRTMYMGMSDHKVIQGIDKIDKQFKKHGVKAPFLGNIPELTAKEGTPEYQKQVQARTEYMSKVIHDFGRLEARYELLTLLANTGTLTANMFGGTTMTISSAGMRNFTRANNFKWMEKNVLFDKGGNPTLTYVNNAGKKVTVRTKEDLKKWIQDKGVIDNFINDELNTNIGLKNAIGKNKKASMDFIRDLKKLLRENPDANNETVLELARRYGVQDTMLKFGGAFMQVSERKLRRDAFLSHALQAKDRLGVAGRNMSLDDPYLVDSGLRGVEATQFLYHSAFRPAFMRTSMGKVMTRFRLFAFQSIRVRKELERRANYYGYKKGTKDYENMKNLFLADMLTMALGSVFMYSLFDTALPPPYDYLQETSQLLFGDKGERNKAFYGTYPRPIAPLQAVTPPVARVLIDPLKSLIIIDWDRFFDYHIHTMYPFGRIVRQIDKTIDEPYGTTLGRGMQQFFRLPGDKLVNKYNRAQLEEERKRIITQTLGE